MLRCAFDGSCRLNGQPNLHVQPFLTANWRYLAMLNYVVDPRLIASLVPSGTEIDFEEVNLRFYVRRKSADTWRRGVVFIRELVPRRAIALIARAFYGENYVAVPMKHEIEHADSSLKAEYSWRRGRKWESLKMSATGQPQSIPAGSHAEFITEHYWGYTALRSGCGEYRVEHPRWKIWNASSFELNADVATLYGQQFLNTLDAPPRSAFIADGSPITVHTREAL